jgi:hypothetical protein
MHATTNKHGKMMWSNPEFKPNVNAIRSLMESSADGGMYQQLYSCCG